MWLGQESVGGRTNVEKCTCVHKRVEIGYWMRRVQGFKAEQISAPVGLRDCRQDVVGPRECRWSDQCGEVHLCVPESGNRLLDEESAGVPSGENESTCRSQRLQTRCGRTKRVQVVGPSREVHLCAPECGNVLPLDEESALAGDKSGAQECTCRHQRLEKRCGWAKRLRVQVVGPMWRSAPLCTKEWKCATVG